MIKDRSMYERAMCIGVHVEKTMYIGLTSTNGTSNVHQHTVNNEIAYILSEITHFTFHHDTY